MSADKATPRPWRLTPSIDGRNVYLVSTHGGLVPVAQPYRADAFDAEEEASCIDGKERCEAARANAALIVRAVNAHEALVSALRTMVDRFQPGTSFPELDAARAALALAEGGDR